MSATYKNTLQDPGTEYFGNCSYHFDEIKLTYNHNDRQNWFDGP